MKQKLICGDSRKETLKGLQQNISSRPYGFLPLMGGGYREIH